MLEKASNISDCRNAAVNRKNNLTFKIAVIGAGYVGLTIGVCLAKLGHSVTCADIDPIKIGKLRRGRPVIVEEGLAPLLRDGLAKKNLNFVVGGRNAVRNADFVFMCLPTPEGQEGKADLFYLMQAAQEIADILPSGSIIVNKSTAPVGTCHKISRIINRSDIQVVSNPEFLREGASINDFFYPDRIVIGANNLETAQKVAEIYSSLDSPLLLVNTATAELIKYAANAFLATKLSFVNSIINLSEAIGADGHQVLKGMGHDKRIGHHFLSPGPGWGGSCFPKDVNALFNIAKTAGYDFDLLKAVIRHNDLQTELMVNKIERLLGDDLKNKTVAAWGLAFKAGTDDIRESPAIKIINKLISLGVHIRAYDPAVTKKISGVLITPDALSACHQADLLVVLTEWPEFRFIDLVKVGNALRSKKVFDTRNILDIEQLKALGFKYQSVGHLQSNDSQDLDYDPYSEQLELTI